MQEILQFDDLVLRLLRLDEDAYLIDNSDERLSLIIVGGGALILQKYISRATHDIDAIQVSPMLMKLLGKYDINCRVSAYLNNFPYNFEDRVKRLDLNTRKIDFYAASLEDIVIAKLHSHRDPDIADIESVSVLAALDWDVLERLALDESELKSSTLSERSYKEFLHLYQLYVGRFRP
ncbi:MAG: DUF6036 family nucleotidyltransferase [Coriobacteriia bacterium]|nr:DUF6036 family nucleotidyltransferase [Coriobacteriia bacterium]MCL2537330.1 DUF6036 family nucleotidyltransferase [Coriobacteriia bacterium]